MLNKQIFIHENNFSINKISLYDCTHIRGYHACRPIDISSYYTYGICAFTEKEKQQKASEIFGKPIEEIVGLTNYPEKEEVYFALSKEDLLKESGHYLCYGSEYFLSKARSLNKNGYYEDLLLKRGTPTIFTCDIPIHLINKYILDDINNNYDPKSLDYGIWINQTLPPKYIIKHEHPKKMFDPFFRFTRINE